jgi:hypothetical protein
MCDDKSICEACGCEEYTYDELLFIDDENEVKRSKFDGLYVCPDCVFAHSVLLDRLEKNKKNAELRRIVNRICYR